MKKTIRYCSVVFSLFLFAGVANENWYCLKIATSLYLLSVLADIVLLCGWYYTPLLASDAKRNTDELCGEMAHLRKAYPYFFVIPALASLYAAQPFLTGLILTEKCMSLFVQHYEEQHEPTSW